MHFHFLLPVLYMLLQAHFSPLIRCLSPENIQELLDSHNYYREVVSSQQTSYTVANMNQLEWSDVLAARAAETVTCQSSRSSQLQQARETLGHVNVGRMRRAAWNLTQVVDRWFAESTNYLPEDKECFPWDGCDSYKNMINARHTNIGCAATNCSGRRTDAVVVMCLYEGGQAGQFGFQIGTPCTGCSYPLSFCQSNMCVRCNSTIDDCDCRKTCTKDGVGDGYLSLSNCSCTCFYGDGPNCDQPCENQQQYTNFDICSLVHTEDCDDPVMGPHYKEYCAAVCSCNPPPANVTEEGLDT